MTLVEWKEEFSVGVPSIDYEHRALIELLNELYMSLSRRYSATAITEFLGEIYAKIAAHFALEEKLMRESHYDQYQEHKADHDHLLEEILDIMDDCEKKETLDESYLGSRLSEWFTTHFKTHDARLHSRLG
ncbi:MAG: hemerythrin family protein [Gammaproteobacteria bacterium]|nr:hemerythrin family protein [Gammaproteobacteria bacterium]